MNGLHDGSPYRRPTRPVYSASNLIGIETTGHIRNAYFTGCNSTAGINPGGVVFVHNLYTARRILRKNI